MANRALVVARKAGALRTTSWSTFCQRSQTSCTTSSASAALPSLRNAAANMRERALMKLETRLSIPRVLGARCRTSMRLLRPYPRRARTTITAFHECSEDDPGSRAMRLASTERVVERGQQRLTVEWFAEKQAIAKAFGVLFL